MNLKFAIVFLVLFAAAAIGGFLMMNEPETYTKATAFNSGNSLVTIAANGDIALQPIGDIDTAIDAAAASVAADANARMAAKYQPKGNYQPAGNYQPKGNYQPAGNYQKVSDMNKYLKLGTTTYIQNADKGSNYFGSYGDRGGFFDASKKPDNYTHWTFTQ